MRTIPPSSRASAGDDLRRPVVRCPPRGDALRRAPHSPLRRRRRPRRRLLRRPRWSDPRPDRPERRRQDDGLQRHHSTLQAGLRPGRLRRGEPAQGGAVRHRPPRHRADVPERRALLADVRARERPRRSAFDDRLVPRGGRPRTCARGARADGDRRPRAARRRLAPLRDAEADRARARARLEAAVAAPRRAGGRPQPRGGARVRRLPAPHQAGARPDRASRRAPHGPRHASLPDDPRARLREADRERHAGRGAGAPGRDRGLPRHGRGREAAGE